MEGMQPVIYSCVEVSYKQMMSFEQNIVSQKTSVIFRTIPASK